MALNILIGFGLAPKYVERFKEGFPDTVFRLSRNKAELGELLPQADVFFGWPTDDIIAAGPRLRWIHILGAGADGFSKELALKRGIKVTNSRGVAAPNIAEHVLALMLSFARDLPTLARAQREQAWSKSQSLRLFELSGQTLGIVGLGAIGQALAQKAGALGMRVLGARRTASPVDGIERVYSVDDLAELAAQVDHFVACLPGTRESTRVIDAGVFAAMRPGTYFYNVGRGSTVDMQALQHALDSGHLAGAGVDVVDPEPLPPGHALWTHPRVIMTSHTAGNTSQYWERGSVLFEKNLASFMAGQPMMNEVDLLLGY